VNRPHVAIVVPCYNEGSRLPIAQFESYLDQNNFVFVFVDDGSSDNTREVLTRMQKGRDERVVVLPRTENQGKAEAVRHGILHALDRGVDYVGFWDADLATPLYEVGNFLEVFEQQPHLEMVFGSRVKLLGRKVERRAVRHYAGRVFATVVSIILRLPIYDTQCGAKMFRCRSGTRALFGEPFLSRWVFDVELVARYIVQLGSADAAAQAIYEYPLHTWTDVRGSKLKPSDFIAAFCDVVRIYWKYLRVDLKQEAAH
jgi:glycosyltransferase involved in cell wall biosynthesis